MTSEVFALTDEQILGMEAEGQDVEPNPSSREQLIASHGPSTTAATAAASARDDRTEKGRLRDARSEPGDAGESLTPEGVSYSAEPPAWLAREMKDPWVGDEARELWEGVQRAQREAAAFREAFGTPEDARALKEIYPGGVAEAKGAAERARELAEIDEVFFGAAGKPVEELRAGRTALVQKLHAQDPAAFREMVEAGARLLEGAGNNNRMTSGEWRAASENSRSLHSESQTARLSGRDDNAGNRQGGQNSADSAALAENKGAQPGMAVPQEVASRYREFERVTNAELEKSVGGAIGRAMEAALPNLRQVGRDGQAPPLQDRLRNAVREEVETALRSDASLGEQVARVLSGRRLDEAARMQVVRLIDARAQQLVPGVVRRVVGSWTQATLGARKTETGAENAGRGGEERRAERAPNTSQRTVNVDPAANRNAQTTTGRSVTRGRVDYRKLSDEQILGM
ncbi:MAG TPA: hypothetical protein VK805_04885 [Candidatus Baltobacteraceae bacterium]|nr:hypothetical protein [Candidatus Baltobacteraceae bacterium]